jgi:hypothetical protein
MNLTLNIADYIHYIFQEEHPMSIHLIGSVGSEEIDGKVVHVFPVSDGENIYKITVEEI